MAGNCPLSLAAAVFLAGATALGQSGGALASGDELVRIALERNRDYLALRQRLAEAQALLRQAGVRPAPTLEVEGSTGRPLGTVGEEEYSAAYFHPIETSGKRGKRIRIAQKSVELVEAEISERRRHLAFEVKTRYAEAVAEQRKIEALDRLVTVHRESHRLTEVRARAGDAAVLEAQLLSTELNKAEAQKAVASGRLASLLLELRQVAGLPGADPLTLGDRIPAARFGYELRELQEQAAQTRPDLRIARLLEQQAEAETELAAAQAHPDLTLSARYSRRYSQFDQLGLSTSGLTVPLRDRDNVLTFGLAIPLLTRRRNQANIDAAHFRVAAARLRRQHLEATIPLEVEAAFRRWSAANRYLDILDRGVMEQSEKNLAVIRQAYELGQLRILDVLNEQRRLIETQLSYIDAQAEQSRALAELERAVGGEIQ
jgi:cobalt-zinc-cadmium efflux system outer membrane protein